MALRPIDSKESSRAAWVVPVVACLVAAAVAAWRAHNAPSREPAPSEAESSSASASEAPRPPPAPRCVEISAEPFVIGEPPPPVVDAGRAADASVDDDDEEDAGPIEEAEDPIAPFAVEIGRGAAFDGGFAAGARRDGEGGAIAMVAIVGADGKNGRLVRLGRSRGDLDAPVVAAAGGSVLAVMIEPNASGRALKVAKVTGSDVTWGPEFFEGRDTSLAVDVAASGARAVLVWDDLTPGPEESRRSNVMLASLDVTTMKAITPAHPISAPTADATAPRLITRPGGYWLGYLAHGEEDPKKKAAKHEEEDDDDEGEGITTSWVEVVPLDESGGPAGAARAITSKKGHALAFDLEPAENGSALLAWRDDDTPTGASGGKVSAALVRLGGVGETRVLAEAAGGSGAPDLLPGWISLASVNGATRIAALSPSGELLDALAPEPSLGTGEPIAATRDAILWARPMGQAMRLSLVRCRARPAERSAERTDAGG